ncbi:MAG TPA: hypothetical protein VIG25_21350 [Pyrinomonadaceae bacterium]|jgi:hypothetical protein
MKRAAWACGLLFVIAGLCSAQTKPWTEWSKKDVDKTLNDSAWGQTQVEERAEQPKNVEAVTQVAAPRAANKQMEREGESGEAKAVASIKYRVRFLSAKPIRAAFARNLLLAQQEATEELKTQLQTFVDRDFSSYIVVAVSVEVGDEKMIGPIMRAFTAATTEALQNQVYLERKDGKRLLLMEYRPPTQDGMGAKFVFKRSVDGQAFLDKNDNVRFFAQLNEKMKVNTRYKVSEMLYDGRLEY